MQFSKNHPGISQGNGFRLFVAPRAPTRLVGVPGVEPGTSSLSGTRSNQLSYTPDTEIRISNIEIRNEVSSFEFRVPNFLRAAQVGGGNRA